MAKDGQEALDYLFAAGAHADRDVTQLPALVRQATHSLPGSTKRRREFASGIKL
jgi:hypothetical protein